METLIIHPENKEQSDALKNFMKAFNIFFESKEFNESDKFNFSALAGKLEWEGNALEEQKN